MTTDRDNIYRQQPELTHYVSTRRYDTPKEDFKTIAARLASLVDADAALDVADVGCANGELLYLLKQRFPRWRLHGFDYTAEFVETARGFPGLVGVHFEQRDLHAVDGEYDVVLATCFLSLFEDIERPLDKLVALCRPGGVVLATGLFNPHHIEVRVRFCDNTSPRTRGVWRTDFNRHSQASIREMLDGRASRVDFEDCRYDLDLPPDPEHPIRVWSVGTDDGALLVNGAWQINNQTLMIIRK